MWLLSAPASCPRWHGVFLKVSGLGHLVLLVLVVVLSVQGERPALIYGPKSSFEGKKIRV